MHFPTSAGTRVTIPLIVRELKSEDRHTRAAAADALGNFRGKAGPAIPALVEALRDEDHMGEGSVAAVAEGSLVKIGPITVPALARALKDERVCYRAARTLRAIGVDAVCSVPALAKRLGRGRGRSLDGRFGHP